MQLTENKRDWEEEEGRKEACWSQQAQEACILIHSVQVTLSKYCSPILTIRYDDVTSLVYCFVSNNVARKQERICWRRGQGSITPPLLLSFQSNGRYTLLGNSYFLRSVFSFMLLDTNHCVVIGYRNWVRKTERFGMTRLLKQWTLTRRKWMNITSLLLLHQSKSEKCSIVLLNK